MRIYLNLTLVTVFSIVVASQSLRAQQENVKVDSRDIILEQRDLPGSVGGKPPVDEYRKNWYMVDVKFSTEKDITEEITVKVYLEAYDFFKEEAEQPAFVILTSEVTFINVLKSDEHHATFYLHPGSAERYSGSKPARDFGGNKDYNVRVEISESRQPAVGIDMFEDEVNWFLQGQQVPDVLMSVEESPWWPFEAARYSQIKKRR